MTKPSEHRPEEPAPKARHGPPSELSWHSGQGRQPYANQGSREAEETNCGDHYDSGDRGVHSGTNLTQMEQVRGTPQEPPPQKDSP